MTDYPGEHPEPPPDINDRSPLIFTPETGQSLTRIHLRTRSALFFGRTGNNRFDAPDKSFGVLYGGMDEYCSFIETFGQSTGSRIITRAALEQRHLSYLKPKGSLVLIDLAGSGGLARIGADARLLAGSHAIAQRWSAALHQHPIHPNGILYPARHDVARNACALFDSPGVDFDITDVGSLFEPQHSALLGAILDKYGFGLID